MGLLRGLNGRKDRNRSVSAALWHTHAAPASAGSLFCTLFKACAGYPSCTWSFALRQSFLTLSSTDCSALTRFGRTLAYLDLRTLLPEPDVDACCSLAGMTARHQFKEEAELVSIL